MFSFLRSCCPSWASSCLSEEDICPVWASPKSFQKSPALLGQVPFPVSVAFARCRQATFFSYFALAQRGQAVFLLIWPLPAVGKPSSRKFRLCPMLANTISRQKCVAKIRKICHIHHAFTQNNIFPFSFLQVLCILGLISEYFR